ncbi:posphoenolpyruvate synthetase regulatory kinase/phosphorylase PpsR [Pelistega europaea]|uniref:Putative phosphoenolpyruvate synthase regulatory protein n=1 Tax=Pelistega europaea TaxID=106147 RepID=A0A7Y4L8M9_9BURK|nr:pyruvate, water dikinase regulatory protein [Pelistega europaea]NOL48962.1 kinase/pyrophosphorylase [Pelistega europaea]
MSLPQKTVFVISDGTGITAETFSHSVLSQFTHAYSFKQVREPFVTTVSKMKEIIESINEIAEKDSPPIIFSTIVDQELVEHLRHSKGIFLDIFGACVNTLELSLQIRSKPTVGRSHLDASSESYHKRIEAINFTLAHDDGQFIQGLQEADVILIGVSRSGKTPTSLYLAMQHSLKVANFPLIPEDFERGQLPKTIKPFKHKLFGLSIQPERLSEIRSERRPNSQYASIEQCRHEVAESEHLMRMQGITWLSSTTKSIEEIATTVLQILKLNTKTY